MWLKSIRVANIKCFADTGEISFIRNRTKSAIWPYKWVTFLGENGVGKSTMLQAMGLLLAGPEAAKELLPRPEGWVRNPQQAGKLTASIHQDDGDNGTYGGQQKERRIFRHSYLITGDQPLEVSIKGRKRIMEETYTEPAIIEESDRVLSWLRTNAFASGNSGWFSVGYGPFRRLTREHRILLPSLSAPTRSSNFITQFDDNEPINSFERWMVYLDFRIAKDATDDQARKMLTIGKKAITGLLPGTVKIKEVTKAGLILFDMEGQVVPSVSLSDGYRSIIALAGDLIWRLLQTFPDLEDPTQANGIVLIDELDIHLHPVWQRSIAELLQKSFPNLQFFVATHSPLIAAGAGEDALTLRFEMQRETGEVTIQRIANIATYDVDRILTSEAFGLVSTFSPQAQEKIEQYHQLQFKFPDLEPDEKKIYEELRVFMQKAMPVNGVPEPGTLEDRINKFLEQHMP